MSKYNFSSLDDEDEAVSSEDEDKVVSSDDEKYVRQELANLAGVNLSSEEISGSIPEKKVKKIVGALKKFGSHDLEVAVREFLSDKGKVGEVALYRKAVDDLKAISGLQTMVAKIEKKIPKDEVPSFGETNKLKTTCEAFLTEVVENAKELFSGQETDLAAASSLSGDYFLDLEKAPSLLESEFKGEKEEKDKIWEEKNPKRAAFRKQIKKIASSLAVFRRSDKSSFRFFRRSPKNQGQGQGQERGK